MPLTVVCKEALQAVADTRHNLNRFWNLIYAVAVAFSLFIIFLVISLVWGNTPARAVAALATIASGGGLAWVVRQKNAAAKDHRQAQADLRKNCKGARSVASVGTADVQDVVGEGLPDDAIELLTPLA